MEPKQVSSENSPNNGGSEYSLSIIIAIVAITALLVLGFSKL